MAEDTYIDKFRLGVPEVELDLVYGWSDLQWVSSEVFNSIHPSESM